MPAKQRPYAETVVDEYDCEGHPNTLLHQKSANARKQQSLPSDSGYSSTGLTSSASIPSQRQLAFRSRPPPSSTRANVGSESERGPSRPATTEPTRSAFHPPPGNSRRAVHQPPPIQTQYSYGPPQQQTHFTLPPASAGLPPPSAGPPPSSFPQHMALPPPGAFPQPPPPQRRRSQSAARRPVSYTAPPDGYPFSPPAHNSPNPHAAPRPTVRVPAPDGGYWERDYNHVIDEAPPVGSRPLKRGNSKRENRRNSYAGDYFDLQPRVMEQTPLQYPAAPFPRDEDLMPPPPPRAPARPPPRQPIQIPYRPVNGTQGPDYYGNSRSGSYQDVEGALTNEYGSLQRPRQRSDVSAPSFREDRKLRRAEAHIEGNGDRTANSRMEDYFHEHNSLARSPSKALPSRTASRANQSITESELTRRTRISFDGGDLSLEPGRNINISCGEDGSQSVIISPAANSSRGSQSYRAESNGRSTRGGSFADRSVQPNRNGRTDSGASQTRKAPVLPKKDSNGS